MRTSHGTLDMDGASYSYSDIENAVRGLKGMIFDVDGVFTDNRVPEGGDLKLKYRSYYDGQGVSLLRAIGIEVCLVTNEKDASAKHIVDVVAKWNGLPSSLSQDKPDGWAHVTLYQGMGGEKKVLAAEDWFYRNGLSWANCGAMGDDLVDAPMLKKAVLRCAPSSAELAIQELVHFVSRRRGGYGAVRDIANFILEVRGINPLDLPPQ